MFCIHSYYIVIYHESRHFTKKQILYLLTSNKYMQTICILVSWMNWFSIQMVVYSSKQFGILDCWILICLITMQMFILYLVFHIRNFINFFIDWTDYYYLVITLKIIHSGCTFLGLPLILNGIFWFTLQNILTSTLLNF